MLAPFALLPLSRICHVGILWEGDSYPLAAAQQMLHGRMLYRDLWFDKPPLLPAAYLLWGAQAGWALRLADSLYALLACWIAYRFAREVWSEAEGWCAAGLLAFFLIFDVPSAAIPMASDLMMLAPHLAAVWMAWKRRPLWSGALAAVAFWISPKGVFVAAACALWDPAGIPWMAAGFGAVSSLFLGWLGLTGSLGAYWEQVWQWGRLYAASPFVESPVRNGLIRTASWAGFHGALIVSAGWFLREKGRWRWVGWLVISLAGVAAGFRFFPRYYFLLLPPLVIMAARGVMWMRVAFPRWLLAALLLIPLVRFGPSYATALRDTNWRDTAMDRDSRAAARIVRGLAHPGDTLFVWGYRPELYVYTGLKAATRYLDSQPLSGVPADRHLAQSEPIETAQSARRLVEAQYAHPAFLVDGLGLYNPRLAVGKFWDMDGWRETARTGGTIIYQPNRESASPEKR